jgi:ankyrin repeat protein
MSCEHTDAASGDLELISALVENGSDLERGDDTQQNTAFQYAFYHGQVEAARLLISVARP